VTRAVSLLFHDVYRTDPADSGFGSEAAHRYKLSLADFTAQLDRVAAVRQDSAILVDGHGEDGARADAPAPRPPRGEERTGSASAQPLAASHSLPWLITFDDGGVSYHTLIADQLESRGWRGHCFVSTDFTGRHGFLDAAQLRDLHARGHVIGSHSASHPARFSTLPYPAMVAEWRQSRDTLEDLLGAPVTVASVPGGYFSPAVARAAHEAGITVLFTSEPETTIEVDRGLTVIGRFTIRHGDAPDTASRFVQPAAWARTGAWVSWNAKALVKPVLGPSYMRVSDWIHALRRPEPRPW
jgi:peptidoglycan/xylan/chitin deacetylase (PgdA/CDA1 family)